MFEYVCFETFSRALLYSFAHFLWVSVYAPLLVMFCVQLTNACVARFSSAFVIS